MGPRMPVVAGVWSIAQRLSGSPRRAGPPWARVAAMWSRDVLTVLTACLLIVTIGNAEKSKFCTYPSIKYIISDIIFVIISTITSNTRRFTPSAGKRSENWRVRGFTVAVTPFWNFVPFFVLSARVLIKGIRKSLVDLMFVITGKPWGT